MPRIRELSDEDWAQAAREIDNFFTFSRDVLDDPSILEKISTASSVEAIPKGEAEAGQPYDIETTHMVATVTPPPRLKRVRRGGSKTVQDLGDHVANRKPRSP